MGAHRVSLKQLLKIGTEALSTTAQTLSGAINEIRANAANAYTMATTAYNKAGDALMQANDAAEDATDALDNTKDILLARYANTEDIIGCMSAELFKKKFLGNVSAIELTARGLVVDSPADVSGSSISGVTVEYYTGETRGAPGILKLTSGSTTRSAAKYLLLYNIELQPGTYYVSGQAGNEVAFNPPTDAFNIVVRKGSPTGTQVTSVTNVSSGSAVFTLTTTTTVYVLLKIPTAFKNRTTAVYIAPNIYAHTSNAFPRSLTDDTLPALPRVWDKYYTGVVLEKEKLALGNTTDSLTLLGFILNVINMSSAGTKGAMVVCPLLSQRIENTVGHVDFEIISGTYYNHESADIKDISIPSLQTTVDHVNKVVTCSFTDAQLTEDDIGQPVTLIGKLT